MQWQRSRPEMLHGVCWYRLPVAGDNLNWNWKTLQAVMEGRTPKRELRLVASTSQPSDVVAINTGEADESLPQIIFARWRRAALIAADALEGYTLKQNGDENMVTFE